MKAIEIVIVLLCFIVVHRVESAKLARLPHRGSAVPISLDRVKRVTHPEGQHPPPPDLKTYDRNNDPHPNHRNFLRTGPDGLYYTVRTGSKPTDQDGPIVAFFYKPSQYADVPGKFYVRDMPFYF